ncbi:MAG: cytochrome C [Betaproteobacteria bacterium]|nr:MAG: cytochrome C [Betaproteobacteria bacterium]
MPQVFHPPLVLVLKLVALALLLIAGAGWITLYMVLPPRGGPVDPRQPIPFSHQHHVGDDGIDCRYCHWSVEKSAYAGIPSAQVCLTCHSQLFSDAPVLEPLRESARTGRPIRWVRVHELPDFVFFDHSIHVAKGVGCVECHGRVDKMPRIHRVASLEMQWCLECHRRMARMRGLDERRMTDCSTCHR